MKDEVKKEKVLILLQFSMSYPDEIYVHGYI